MKRGVVVSSAVGVAALVTWAASSYERAVVRGDVSSQAMPRPPIATVPPAVQAALSTTIAPQRQPAPPTSVPEEAAFMTDLRVLSEMEPELAIERAKEGATRYGNSADASERRSILIHALARVGRASEARGEAERMVNECPDDAWVGEIERFTGAHRHRNIRLAANGQLEYE